MLKSVESLSYRDRQQTETALGDVLTFLIGMVRRQLPVIIFFMLLLTAVGVAYVLLTPPSYSAKALIIADSPRILLTKAFEETQVSPSAMDTQVEVLKTEAVLLPVIKKLQLAKRSQLSGPGDEPESVVTRRILHAMQDSLTIARIGRSQVIEIGYKSPDQDLAFLVPNAIAESYIVDQQEARSQAARKASAWLQGRLKELGEQAASAERAVVEFKRKNNIIDAGGKLIDEQQLAELNSKLTLARSRVSEARAKLSRVQTILANRQGGVAVDATVADALKSDVVTQLRSRYLDLAARAADYADRFGSSHLAVVRMRNQMQQIRTSINDELKRLAETYKSDLEIAMQEEAETQKQLAGAVANSQATNQAQITLRELESLAHSYRALYDNFLQRDSEQVQQQSMRFPEARLVSPARRPLQKSQPKTLLALAIAVIAGTVIGLGVGVARDMLDGVFRTRQQVEKFLSKYCLALAPKLKAVGASHSPKKAGLDKEGGRAYLGEEVDAAKAERNVILSTRGPATAVIDAPFSRFAEAIHHIRLAAEIAAPRRTGMVIGVTSALPDEGKSTIAVNLARLLARSGEPTVLVDCDLRISRLTKNFSPDADAGVREVIAGTVSLDDNLWRDEYTNMMFLPAHGGPGLEHPNEILSSAAAESLFQKLRDGYKWVIVDLPPTEPVIDVRSTEHFVDFYVLVIEWGQTKVATVKRALSELRGINDRVLGAVLNKVDMDLLPKYEGYSTGYADKYYRLLDHPRGEPS